MIGINLQNARALLGLPRVVSTRDDLAAIFAGTQIPANGITDQGTPSEITDQRWQRNAPYCVW